MPSIRGGVRGSWTGFGSIDTRGPANFSNGLRLKVVRTGMRPCVLGDTGGDDVVGSIKSGSKPRNPALQWRLGRWASLMGWGAQVFWGTF